jgi:hypothetical protein
MRMATVRLLWQPHPSSQLHQRCAAIRPSAQTHTTLTISSSSRCKLPTLITRTCLPHTQWKLLQQSAVACFSCKVSRRVQTFNVFAHSLSM